MLSMKPVALSVVMWLAAGSFASADVRLSFHDGHISIVARDATVGQILTEWAKVGQTTIVNVERMPGAPLSIELENVSEERALEVMFRELSGYMAAPRAVAVPSASRFDRIIVVPPGSLRPTSAAPSAAQIGALPAYQTPADPEPQSAFVSHAAKVRAPSAYQTPAYAQQQPAFIAPAANVRAPSAYQPPAYTQQESALVPPPLTDDTANDVNDEPASATVGVAISTLSPRGQDPNAAPHPLETIDPRTFQLEKQQPQGSVASVPPARAVLPFGGVAVPGMIAQPKLQQQPR